MENSVSGKVLPGYGVASGKGRDRRYPGGTLRRQIPYFKNLGLDLSPYFLGTLNLDIAPHLFEIGIPRNFFEKVDWSEHIPPENFYFFDLKLIFREKQYVGLIYMPDPETKVEHEQGNTTLELILPKIPGIQYGDIVRIGVPGRQMKFCLPE